ncbi:MULTISPECIES: hypothetical protein [unclassified Frankia]|uniref:hypothetical protein n=1 Tax=unclassified Frankia TaxID=2632575 RepID=UPI001EF65AAE|nr:MULTISPECIES: hypothetical protein [unclassified Frankia]
MTSYLQVRGQVDGIRTGAVPNWLTRILARAAATPADAVVLYHPLGFLCFPVWRSDEGGACVHVWDRRIPAARPTTSAVHCHSWDLYSLVLDGEVRNQTVRTIPAAAPPAAAAGRGAPAFTYQVFDVHNHHDRGVDEIRGTGEFIRCEPGAAESLRAGDVYSMAAGTFHLTSIAGDAAATLMLARNQPGRRDRTVGASDLSDHHVQRRRCDAATCAWAAKTILRLLADTGNG